MLNWYDWHTVSERLQGRLYALTHGKPFRLRLDPNFPTGYCDLEHKTVGINPVAFSDIFEAEGLDGEELDEANFLMSRALTGHEALHTDYTDAKALREACSDKQMKFFWNILEDARIEGIGAASSHVSRLLFRLIKRSLAAQMPEFTDPECKDPASWFYLLMRWRCGLRIPEISDDAKVIWRQVRTIAENSLYDETSWEVLESAREIMKVTGADKKRRKKTEMGKDMEDMLDKQSSEMKGDSKPKDNPREKPEEKGDQEDADDQPPDSDSEEQPEPGGDGEPQEQSEPDADQAPDDKGDGDGDGEPDADGEDQDPGSDPGSQDVPDDSKEDPGEQDDQDGDGEGKDSSEPGADDEDDPDSENFAGDDDETDDRTPAPEDSEEDDSEEGAKNVPGATDSDEEEDDEAGARDVMEDLKDLLKSVSDQVRDKLSDVVPQGNQTDLLVAGSKDGRHSAIVAAPYIHLLDQAMPIAQVLERELKGEDPKAVAGPSRTAGRFKARYYVRDNEQAFAQVKYHGMKTPQMALTLILDRSGSMQSNINELRVMAMSIYLVCERLRIPLAIWVLEGQVHLKRFDDWGPHILAKIAGIEADTLTKMMPTISDACDELIKRPETLKQVVLIHDGSPGDRMDVSDWSRQISAFGLFCMYIMPETVYEQAYLPAKQQFEEQMTSIFGARRFAIAKVHDMGKYWCSHMRNKRKAYSTPV